MPLPLLGIPDGFDTPEHLRFVETYLRAMESGIFMPRWAAADNYGFGSVGIRFYPPLAHYLMSAVQEFTRDSYDTIIITSFFWMSVGAIGIFLWAREFLSGARSAIVSLLFATLPYHLMQLYVYMLLAEFAAIALLPYCFLFATRIIRRGRSQDVLLFAVLYSAFILTHLPSIIIGTMVLGIYCLFLLEFKDFRRVAVSFAVAFALSLSATAFYLVRLVNELAWVKHNDQQFFANSIYDYRQYLFPMVLNPEKPFWKKMVFLVDIPIFLTFLFLLPPVLCLLLRSVRSKFDTGQAKLFGALTAAGLFLIFILSYPSVFVWDALPLLQKVQFPFRFLSAATIIASLATVISLSAILKAYRRRTKLIGYLVFGVLFATSLFSLTQIIIPSEADQRVKFDEKMAAAHELASCRCWWPIWADSRAFNDRTQAAADGRTVTIQEWNDESRTFIVDPGSPGNLRVATFWYPYWRASINGNEAASGPDVYGAALIPIPAERSKVHLEFREPFFVQGARYFSLLAWAVILVGLIARKAIKRRPQIRSGSSHKYDPQDV